jgi:hypothetical protein
MGNSIISREIRVIIFITLLSFSLKSQPELKGTSSSLISDTTKKKIVSDRLNHFSYGIMFNQYGGDNGVALDITSPYFDVSDNHNGEEFGAFRITAGVNDMYGVLPGGTNSTMFPYYVFHLGFIDRIFIIKQKIALLGDFGGTLILPNSQTSSQSTLWGGYILPGVEFYSSLRKAVFFEMGGTLNQSCIADKLMGEPHYYTNRVGFIMAVGGRLYL